MSLVHPGTLRLTVPGQTEEALVAVPGGLLEVQPEKITILADMAIRSGEMDQARTEEAKRVAEAGISQTQDDESSTRAQVALVAAIAQLRTLDYLRSQRDKQEYLFQGKSTVRRASSLADRYCQQ